MSTHDSNHLRSTTSTGIQASARPNPFLPTDGYVITVTGGIPPYTFTPEPSPPNPPGVQVFPNGNTCEVHVPPGTPPGMPVNVRIYDSSQPPNHTSTGSTTA